MRLAVLFLANNHIRERNKAVYRKYEKYRGYMIKRKIG